MKNKLKKSENLFSAIRIFMVSLLATAFLFSCGMSQEEKARLDKLNEVKQSVTAELEKVNKDITDRIAYLDGEITEATGELKLNLEEARKVLVEQQNIIAQELNLIKESSLETWDENVKKVSENLKNIRIKTNETSKKVRELLDS